MTGILNPRALEFIPFNSFVYQEDNGDYFLDASEELSSTSSEEEGLKAVYYPFLEVEHIGIEQTEEAHPRKRFYTIVANPKLTFKGHEEFVEPKNLVQVRNLRKVAIQNSEEAFIFAYCVFKKDWEISNVEHLDINLDAMSSSEVESLFKKTSLLQTLTLSQSTTSKEKKVTCDLLQDVLSNNRHLRKMKLINLIDLELRDVRDVINQTFDFPYPLQELSYKPRCHTKEYEINREFLEICLALGINLKVEEFRYDAIENLLKEVDEE